MILTRPEQFTSQPALVNYLTRFHELPIPMEPGARYPTHLRLCMTLVEGLAHDELPQTPDEWYDRISVRGFMALSHIAQQMHRGVTDLGQFPNALQAAREEIASLVRERRLEIEATRQN
ncbi:MAG TPA: hypothetical protein VGE52_12290 [Pirellulales bacterium]